MQECASCHIGYGWVDANFDFTNPVNIDCLVCHDTTGTYRKEPGRAGMPDPSLDLAAMARKVGRPSRRTCGSCHFASGGGGPYTKHGDLEPALVDPPAELDVHMGALKMRCQNCHQTTDHRIAGMSMSAPAVEGRVGCEKCHGQTPHGVAGVLEPAPRRSRQGRGVRDVPHPVDCARVADAARTRLLHGRRRPAQDSRSLRHAAVRQALRHPHMGQGPSAYVPVVRRHPERLARRRHHRSVGAGGPQRAGWREAESGRADLPVPGARGGPALRHGQQGPGDTEAARWLLGRFRLVEGDRERDEAGERPVLRDVRIRRNEDVLVDPPRGRGREEGARVRRLPCRPTPSHARGATRTRRGWTFPSTGARCTGMSRGGSTSRRWAIPTTRHA